ncbi:MAG: nicotinate (nicotinamide) nucleotide adenylyltransferase [Ruminococcaceae bacterium]|nr:nicotinate (nicotinamide) nucleotide adenylyltransferase [Oscillospiraceae bacterium]
MDKVVAIFGGTFNPIHKGHVEMAREVLCLPQVERLIIMPTFLPPHKAASALVPGEDRLNMCKIALEDLKNVEFSDLELSREGVSYTYDTVCELGEKLNRRIALVLGGDMVTTFTGWYRFKDILKLVDLIAFRRIGVDNSEFDKAIENLRDEGGRITVIDSPISDISSTEVRKGEWDLLPEKVLEYIKQKGLYGEK